MRLLLTLTISLAFYSAKTQGTHPLASLGGNEKEHYVELDGSMSPTLFAQMVQQVRTWSHVSVSNVNNQQLQSIIEKCNSLGEVKSLVLQGINFPDSSLQNAHFGTASLTLDACSLKDKSHSVKVPATKEITLENTSAPLVLAVLQANPGTRLLSVSNCDLSGEKDLFGFIEKSPIRELSLTYCALQRLPIDLLQMQALRTLDISNNNISLIDTTGIFKLSEFDCEGNPIAGILQQYRNKKENKPQPFSYTNGNDPLFLSAHPFLKPASSTYNVTPQSFEINGRAQIKTGEGAYFKIPEKAFINSKGEEVTGPVKVIVREYNSPLSVILAGIPMFLDTAGKKDYLVSDGMFEIEAYAGNEKLELKPGKKIGVDYPSANKLTNGNQLYDLNPQTGGWDNVSQGAGFSGKTVVRKDTLGLTPAVQRYRTLTQVFQTVNDGTTYDQRFSDKWHCGELLLDSALVSSKYKTFEEVYTENPSADAFIVQKRSFVYQKEPMTIVRIIPHDKDARRMYTPVRSLWWKILDDMTPEQLETLSYGNSCDIRFEVRPDSTILLHLKNHNGLHSFQVEGFSYSHADYMKKRAYKTASAMVARQHKHNANAAKASHEIHTPYAFAGSRTRWKKIKRLRNAAERKMSFNEFRSYATRGLFDGYQDVNTQKVAYQFSLTGLGLKNIDCRHGLSQPIDLVAKTFDNDTIIQSYVYQPSAKLLINFYSYGHTSHILAEKNRDTYVVNVCNGEVSYAHFNSKEMHDIPANETMCTPVKVPVDQFSLDKMDEDLKRLAPRVYPNPNTGIFALSMAGYEHFDVAVYSLGGHLVRTIKDHMNGAELDLSELNNGHYLLIIKENGKNISSVKVAIQK